MRAYHYQTRCLMLKTGGPPPYAFLLLLLVSFLFFFMPCSSQAVSQAVPVTLAGWLFLPSVVSYFARCFPETFWPL